MVLHNPNNWHWVNKDVKEWAREYLVKNVVGLSAEDGGNEVTIKHIDTMEGDVDVSQRKGKVITLFDVKLVLDFGGMALAPRKRRAGLISLSQVRPKRTTTLRARL